MLKFNFVREKKTFIWIGLFFKFNSYVFEKLMQEQITDGFTTLIESRNCAMTK